jgi:hypothetical protein
MERDRVRRFVAGSKFSAVRRYRACDAAKLQPVRTFGGTG